MITVLCAARKSYYFDLPGLDVYGKERNAYNFTGTNPVIAHPPCAQWSRLRSFARFDLEEKGLANFCWEVVNKNGGVFEHPLGSSFFKNVRIDMSKLYSVDQSWFGFPARKRTLLYFHKCKPLAFPLKFDAVQVKVENMGADARSLMTYSFATWLVKSVSNVQ